MTFRINKAVVKKRLIIVGFIFVFEFYAYDAPLSYLLTLFLSFLIL